MATTAKKAAPKAKEAPAKKPAAAKAAAVPKTAAPAKAKAPAKPAPAKATPAKATPAKVKAPAKPAPAKAAPAKAKTPAKKASAPKPAPTSKPVTKPVTKPATQSVTKPAAKPAAKAVAAKQPTPAAKNKAETSKAIAAGLISEAVLLKMSDKDYMNDQQLAFFKAKLLAMREEILSNARETGEHLKENEVFADPNDRATVEEENMLEQRVRDRERKLMKKINQALQRIESGEYGYCLETGEPIGIPRLLARPTAELSIEAQEKHERREKLFAD